MCRLVGLTTYTVPAARQLPEYRHGQRSLTAGASL